jgi:hypothetical protein
MSRCRAAAWSFVLWIGVAGALDGPLVAQNDAPAPTRGEF